MRIEGIKVRLNLQIQIRWTAFLLAFVHHRLPRLNHGDKILYIYDIQIKNVSFGISTFKPFFYHFCWSRVFYLYSIFIKQYFKCCIPNQPSTRFTRDNFSNAKIVALYKPKIIIRSDIVKYCCIYRDKLKKQRITFI